MKPGAPHEYANLCGRVLARAHSRSGDAVVILGYLVTGGTFIDAVAEFSAAYARQNERDYWAFLKTVGKGRIEIQAE